MLQRDITIINKLGLHARASAKLTQLASKFDSQIKMSRNGRQVDAKSIMGVMMLAAGLGSSVELECHGGRILVQSLDLSSPVQSIVAPFLRRQHSCQRVLRIPTVHEVERRVFASVVITSVHREH